MRWCGSLRIGPAYTSSWAVEAWVSQFDATATDRFLLVASDLGCGAHVARVFELRRRVDSLRVATRHVECN